MQKQISAAIINMAIAISKAFPHSFRKLGWLVKAKIPIIPIIQGNDAA